MILDQEAREQVKELELILHQIHRITRYQTACALADVAPHIITNKLLEGEIYYGHRKKTKQSKDSTDS